MLSAVQNSGVRLLPRTALIKSGSVDHADWNYRPFLGWIQQIRFRLAVCFLPRYRVHRILEVGYGSGIFMPELAARCRELYGIDVHTRHTEVARILESHGVRARLFTAGAESMPFPENFFNRIVAVSSLEFVNDIEAGGRELARVLQPDGALIMVTPGHSPLLDLGLKILTGENAGKDYGGRREALLPGLTRYFTIERRRSVPISTSATGVYLAYRLRKLNS